MHLYAWWILFFIELNGSLTLRGVYMCDVVYVCSYLCMCDCLHILCLCMNIYAYVYKWNTCGYVMCMVTYNCASIHVFMWLCMNVCLCINVFIHMCICYMPLCVNLCGRYDLNMYLCCTCVCVSVCSDMCRLCTVTCVPILVHCILFFCVYGQLLLFSLWWLSSCSLRKGLEW